MTSKNATAKFITPTSKQIHTYVVGKYNLNRRDATVLFKLLGFLLRNDFPFPYSSDKLCANTLYKRSSVFEALKSLEKKGLIKRQGLSYQLRYSKGFRLSSSYTQVQNCLNNMLYIDYPPVQNLEAPVQNLDTPVQKLDIIELKTELKIYKRLGGLPKIKNPKTQTQKKFPELSAEDKDLLSAFQHGKKYPAMQLTGTQLLRAQALLKRLS